MADPQALVRPIDILDQLVQHQPGEDQYRPLVQQFVVCGLPDGHPMWESYAIIVTNRGGGWWQVRRGAKVVSVDGREYPPLRDDAPDTEPWLFMRVGQALQVADRHARTVRLRPGTAAELLAKEAAERAAAEAG